MSKERKKELERAARRRKLTVFEQMEIAHLNGTGIRLDKCEVELLMYDGSVSEQARMATLADSAWEGRE